ncbi:hypothetical protein QAB16_009765 [Acinetobacter nosocomialis]|uniref:hypothetical protein n=1 Tax=Acinetobacter nosocomialis TaxID=106654 RepID=UPI00254E4A89|nr:hypothetical protein [Acinetobacter nosocomialis]MEC6036913.1 hypothetical protein [Acinetobacter nosocomialis]
MENNQQPLQATDNTKKAVTAVKRAAMTAGVVMATTAAAFAEDGGTSIDLTTGLAGVAIIAGLLSVGSLKAVPTYVGWGIRRALSLLR